MNHVPSEHLRSKSLSRLAPGPTPGEPEDEPEEEASPQHEDCESAEKTELLRVLCALKYKNVNKSGVEMFLFLGFESAGVL